MDEQVAGADGGELLAVLERSSGGRATGTQGSTFRSGRSSFVSSADIGEIERPVDRVHEIVGDAQPLLDALAHRRRDRARHLESRHLTEAPAAQLELDGLEQVVGLVRDFEVGVARDAEERALERRPCRGRASARKWASTRSSGTNCPPPPSGEEARQALRDLDPGEALFTGLRIAHEHGEADREGGDVRERLARADGERRQHREDLALEALVELGLLARAQILDPRDDDPLRRERRAQLVRPDARLLGLELEHALARLGERLLRRAAVRRAHR